jgi:hypothetical protein
MMARLTMSDGCTVTVQNLALYHGRFDVSSAESAEPGAEAPAAEGETDHCEFSLPRKAWQKLLHATPCEIELYNRAVFAVDGFQALRDSPRSPSVRVRGSAQRKAIPDRPAAPP